ncbi:MAG: hypothetical protein WA708_10360 [Acidobacteriaceae bacterium]
MVEFDQKSNLDHEMEQELRAALRPLPAPSGFANRVVARSQALPLVKALPFPAQHRRFHGLARWSIAAVLLLAIGFGGFFEHQRQRRIAGEQARQQVLLALRLTSVTLQAVRHHVEKSSTN